jgi:hypothetical protein
MELNKEEIYIFDDLLDQETQDQLEDRFYKMVSWRWRASYARAINKEELGNSRPLALDVPEGFRIKIKDEKYWMQSRPGLFVSEFYDVYHGWVFNADQNIVLPVLEAFKNLTGLDYKIQRIKANFNSREVIENKGSCYVPHVDIENGGGWTGIYYINNSDGDTVIFNEKTNNPVRNQEEISVKQVIQNKKGRFVLFNQDNLHAGCPPIESDNRLLINYNIKL